MRLKDKVAIVTGAGTGLGRAIALMFGREGAMVTLNGRRAEPLEKAAAEIRQAGGTAFVSAGDVTRAADVERLVNTVLKSFGRLDILVNNAGGIAERGPVLGMRPTRPSGSPASPWAWTAASAPPGSLTEAVAAASVPAW